MTAFTLSIALLALAPPLLMAAVASLGKAAPAGLWTAFKTATALATLAAIASLGCILAGVASIPVAGLEVTLAGAWVAVLVQVLGSVIGVFSARYLVGEAGQARYIAAFAGVLAAVHLLLLAEHVLLLVGAWALVGILLKRLLCFYGDRPFALLAAHKKHLADRAADVLLLGAAALLWYDSGSGSIDSMLRHASASGGTPLLSLAALLLALAVVLRCALLPVHGWLTQVMEAPTPVSALLHAGVVNLGGFVLIRFAPLFETAPLAQAVLVGAGLTTAVLAGFVMLTRVSVKVGLAWSTVAQMGFMVLECGLGLYQLALLHLIGHSLYKAHNFLAASTVVEASRARMLHTAAASSTPSLFTAPLFAIATIALLHSAMAAPAWPWWWSVLLALAWAPMLWLPVRGAAGSAATVRGLLSGIAMIAGLSAAVLLGHALPLGAANLPHHGAGLVALAGMALMYLGLAALQAGSAGSTVATLRRWSYAGFYLDETYTRIALRLWPTRWSAAPTPLAAALPLTVSP